jgi:hypothetical protein
MWPVLRDQPQHVELDHVAPAAEVGVHDGFDVHDTRVVHEDIEPAEPGF